MKTYGALCLCIILAILGCVPRPNSDHTPAPSRSAVTTTARDSQDDCGSALADSAEEIAKRAEAGEFKSWEEAYDAWSKLNEQVQATCRLKWTAALNVELGFEKQPDGTVKATKDYDAAAFALAARESAKGFRGK